MVVHDDETGEVLKFNSRFKAKEKGALDVRQKPSHYEDLKRMLNDVAAKLCA